MSLSTEFNPSYSKPPPYAAPPLITFTGLGTEPASGEDHSPTHIAPTTDVLPLEFAELTVTAPVIPTVPVSKRALKRATPIASKHRSGNKSAGVGSPRGQQLVPVPAPATNNPTPAPPATAVVELTAALTSAVAAAAAAVAAAPVTVDTVPHAAVAASGDPAPFSVDSNSAVGATTATLNASAAAATAAAAAATTARIDVSAAPLSLPESTQFLVSPAGSVKPLPTVVSPSGAGSATISGGDAASIAGSAAALSAVSASKPDGGAASADEAAGGDDVDFDNDTSSTFANASFSPPTHPHPSPLVKSHAIASASVMGAHHTSGDMSRHRRNVSKLGGSGRGGHVPVLGAAKKTDVKWCDVNASAAARQSNHTSPRKRRQRQQQRAAADQLSHGQHTGSGVGTGHHPYLKHQSGLELAMKASDPLALTRPVYRGLPLLAPQSSASATLNHAPANVAALASATSLPQLPHSLPSDVASSVLPTAPPIVPPFPMIGASQSNKSLPAFSSVASSIAGNAPPPAATGGGDVREQFAAPVASSQHQLLERWLHSTLDRSKWIALVKYIQKMAEANRLTSTTASVVDSNTGGGGATVVSLTTSASNASVHTTVSGTAGGADAEETKIPSKVEDGTAADHDDPSELDTNRSQRKSVRRSGLAATIEPPSTLTLLGIDRINLLQNGLPPELVHRIYRALWVYSVGLHEIMGEITHHCKHPAVVMSIVWRAYALLLEDLHNNEYLSALHALVGSHEQSLTALSHAVYQTASSIATHTAHYESQSKLWHAKYEQSQVSITGLMRTNANLSLERDQLNELSVHHTKEIVDLHQQLTTLKQELKWKTEESDVVLNHYRATQAELMAVSQQMAGAIVATPRNSVMLPGGHMTTRAAHTSTVGNLLQHPPNKQQFVFPLATQRTGGAPPPPPPPAAGADSPAVNEPVHPPPHGAGSAAAAAPDRLVVTDLVTRPSSAHERDPTPRTSLVPSATAAAGSAAQSVLASPPPVPPVVVNLVNANRSHSPTGGPLRTNLDKLNAHVVTLRARAHAAEAEVVERTHRIGVLEQQNRELQSRYTAVSDQLTNSAELHRMDTLMLRNQLDALSTQLKAVTSQHEARHSEQEKARQNSDRDWALRNESLHNQLNSALKRIEKELEPALQEARAHVKNSVTHAMHRMIAAGSKPTSPVQPHPHPHPHPHAHANAGGSPQPIPLDSKTTINVIPASTRARASPQIQPSSHGTAAAAKKKLRPKSALPVPLSHAAIGHHRTPHHPSSHHAHHPHGHHSHLPKKSTAGAGGGMSDSDDAAGSVIGSSLIGGVEQFNGTAASSKGSASPAPSSHTRTGSDELSDLLRQLTETINQQKSQLVTYQNRLARSRQTVAHLRAAHEQSQMSHCEVEQHYEQHIRAIERQAAAVVYQHRVSASDAMVDANHASAEVTNLRGRAFELSNQRTHLEERLSKLEAERALERTAYTQLRASLSTTEDQLTRTRNELRDAHKQSLIETEHRKGVSQQLSEMTASKEAMRVQLEEEHKARADALTATRTQLSTLTVAHAALTAELQSLKNQLISIQEMADRKILAAERGAGIQISERDHYTKLEYERRRDEFQNKMKAELLKVEAVAAADRERVSELQRAMLSAEQESNAKFASNEQRWMNVYHDKLKTESEHIRVIQDLNSQISHMTQTLAGLKAEKEKWTIAQAGALARVESAAQTDWAAGTTPLSTKEQAVQTDGDGSESPLVLNSPNSIAALTAADPAVGTTPISPVRTAAPALTSDDIRRKLEMRVAARKQQLATAAAAGSAAGPAGLTPKSPPAVAPQTSVRAWTGSHTKADASVLLEIAQFNAAKQRLAASAAASINAAAIGSSPPPPAAVAAPRGSLSPGKARKLTAAAATAAAAIPDSASAAAAAHRTAPLL